MSVVNISQEYILAEKAIKEAILQSRYRAARHVNKEVLSLYYWVGNYVSVHSRVGAWNTMLSVSSQRCFNKNYLG